MWLFNFWKKDSKQEDDKPTMVASSLWVIQISYNVDFEIFYKFYKFNPYIRAVVEELMKWVWKHGFAIKRWEKELKIDRFVEMVKYGWMWTSRGFIKRLSRDFKVTWNAFVYIAREKNKVVWFQILDPRTIKPIGDKFGNLLGYYQSFNGELKTFLKDEILHFKTDTSIDNIYMWSSKMESLFTTLETDKEARESNLAFFKNNQTPASIIFLEWNVDMKKESTLEMIKEMKSIFTWGKYKGGKNHHRGAFFAGSKIGILKAQDKITDMQFVELTKFNLQLCCSIYGVPQSRINFTEGVNYTNGENQHEDFEETIVEDEKAMNEFLTQLIQFIPEYVGTTFEFYSDHTRILKAKWKLATDLAGWPVLTPDEAREILQYEPLNTEESKNLRKWKTNNDNQNVWQGNN